VRKFGATLLPVSWSIFYFSSRLVQSTLPAIRFASTASQAERGAKPSRSRSHLAHSSSGAADLLLSGPPTSRPLLTPVCVPKVTRYTFDTVRGTIEPEHHRIYLLHYGQRQPPRPRSTLVVRRLDPSTRYLSTWLERLVLEPLPRRMRSLLRPQASMISPLRTIPTSPPRPRRPLSQRHWLQPLPHSTSPLRHLLILLPTSFHSHILCRTTLSQAA